MDRKWVRNGFLFFLCGWLALAGCAASPKEQASLFSWNPGEVDPSAWPELEVVLEERGISAVYQQMDFNDFAAVERFVAFLSARDVQTYALMGEVDWSFAEYEQPMRASIQAAATYNKDQKEKLAGVVLDVEPYLSTAWKTDPRGVFAQYLKNMESAYRLCEENGLELLLCIPYHFDQTVGTTLLDSLIQNACDGIIVMNYNRRDEIGQIQTEVELARKDRKSVTNAYEFLPAGEHGLTKNNTYAQEDASVLEASRQKLKEAYPTIRFAYHCLEALKER